MDGPVRSLTWPELDEQVSRLAQVLLDEGIRPGDVVGVQLPNTVEIAVAFLAIVRIGAIVAPFPVQYRAYELTQPVQRRPGAGCSSPPSRIGQRPAAAEIAGLRGADPVAADGGRVRSRPAGRAWSALDERIAAADDRSGLAAHLAACVAGPERLRHDLLDLGHREHAQGRAADPLRLDGHVHLARSKARDLTADDVLLNPFPMVNMAGINGMFLPWLKVGGLLVQHHPFDLATFLRQIEQYRATYTVAPPALLTTLLHNEALLAQADISSLRLLGSGSTPLAPSLLQGWHDKYGIEIINFYGSNEGIALLGTPKDIPDPVGAGAVLPALRRAGPTGRSPWRA